VFVFFVACPQSIKKVHSLQACLPADDKTSSAFCRRACPLAIEVRNACRQAGGATQKVCIALLDVSHSQLRKLLGTPTTAKNLCLKVIGD